MKGNKNWIDLSELSDLEFMNFKCETETEEWAWKKERDRREKAGELFICTR